jgi:hypothetical protein
MHVSAAKTALKAFGFDDSDPLNTWLDEGKLKIEEAYDWPLLQVINNAIVVNAGISTIALPGTAFKVQSLRDMTVGRKLNQVDILTFELEVDDPTDQGPPEIYTQTALTTIQLWRVPDQQTTFRVVYQDSLGDINSLADNVSMPGPARLHYQMVLHAAGVGLQAVNEEDRAEKAIGAAEAALMRTVRKYSANLDESKQVQDTMGYGRTR